jgi:ATP/ADP translocase
MLNKWSSSIEYLAAKNVWGKIVASELWYRHLIHFCNVPCSSSVWWPAILHVGESCSDPQPRSLLHNFSSWYTDVKYGNRYTYSCWTFITFAMMTVETFIVEQNPIIAHVVNKYSAFLQPEGSVPCSPSHVNPVHSLSVSCKPISVAPPPHGPPSIWYDVEI